MTIVIVYISSLYLSGNQLYRIFTELLVMKIVSITAVALPGYILVKKDYVRIPYAVFRWCFIPPKEGTVETEYTLEVDVGGKIPRWLANMAATKGPFQTMCGLRKEIKRKKYRKVHLPFIMKPK